MAKKRAGNVGELNRGDSGALDNAKPDDKSGTPKPGYIPNVNFNTPIKDVRVIDSKFVDELFPLVLKLKRVGKLGLVFVDQPRFYKCFDGSGHDNTGGPFGWLMEVRGIGVRIKLAADSVLNFLTPYRYLGETRFDGFPPINALISTCRKVVEVVDEIGVEFHSRIRAIDVDYSDEDDNWGCLFNPDIFLGGPYDDDQYGDQCRKDIDDFHEFVGRMQLLSLNELKYAAENAVYSERWFELIREGIDAPVPQKIKWDDLEPMQQKLIAVLAGGRGSHLSAGQIAIELGVSKTQVEGQLRTDRKLRTFGLVAGNSGKVPSYHLTESGLAVYNARPTGL